MFQLFEHRFKPLVENHLAEVRHLVPVSVEHSLVAFERVGSVGQSVAKFHKCCNFIFAYAFIILVVGTLCTGAAFLVGYGINSFGHSLTATISHVVVGLACILNGVVGPAGGKCGVNFVGVEQVGIFASKIVHHFQVNGVGVCVIFLIGSNVAVGRIFHSISNGIGIEALIQFAEFVHTIMGRLVLTYL